MNFSDYVNKNSFNEAMVFSSLQRYPELAARGERSGTAKLKEADVIEMRNLSSQGVGSFELARRFKIKPQSIWRIVIRKSWRHVI